MMNTGAPTIVILSVDAGSGHRKAGEALGRALAPQFVNWQIVHENVCDFSSPAQKWAIEQLWERISSTPGLRSLYSKIYPHFVSSSLVKRLLLRSSSPAGVGLRARFIGSDVRIVIAMHPAAALAASRWKLVQQFGLYVVCTDLIVHELQMLDNVNGIFCDPGAFMLGDIAEFERGSGRLIFTGLPVGQSNAATLGTDRVGDRFDILVTFGAKGMRARRHIESIIRFAMIENKKVAIVCGKNPGLVAYVEKLIDRFGVETSVRCFGYLEGLDGLLSASKIVVGKPGGITTGEVMQAKKPFVILDHLPGQEEYNKAVLIRFGLGFASSSASMADRLNNALSLGVETDRIQRIGSNIRCGMYLIVAELVRDYQTLEQDRSYRAIHPNLDRFG